MQSINYSFFDRDPLFTGLTEKKIVKNNSSATKSIDLKPLYTYQGAPRRADVSLHSVNSLIWMIYQYKHIK